MFRARDTRLGRSVAIKLLPAELAADARFRIRFDREAKAISSLNHPNICTLYDVGSSDGRAYLVMELCEGPSLAQRIASGRLPLAQALRYGIEIARALETAHRAGVLHRDLKPANVMITDQGAKLVDFGLAITPEREPSGDASQVSTHVQVTQQGEIVGTVAYMAPEVLQGQAADERSDLFALGLVLYEMVTGERPFHASTTAAVIARILETEPKALRALAPAAPPALEQLIRGCLAKDPNERIASAHDVRLQLEWIASAKEEAAPPRARSGMRKSVVAVAGVAAAALTAAAAWMILGRAPARPPAAAPPARTSIDLRGGPELALGKFAPPIGYSSPLVALSNDGQVLVYVGVSDGETQLFRRRIDSFSVAPVEGTRGAHSAFFSPDDAWIGFLAGSSVMKVPAGGGTPVKLGEVAVPMSASWRSLGTIDVIARHGLLRVPANGGIPKQVGPRGQWFCDVLPGGRFALALGGKDGSGDFARVELFDLQTGRTRTLIDRGFAARYVDPGFIVFAHGGDLYAVPFDAERLQITGEPALLERGVAMESFWGIAQYAVSTSGALAYVPGRDRSVGRLTWVRADGSTDVLPFEERLYGAFTLSEDERHIAVEVSDVAGTISIFDVARGEERRMPVPGLSQRPAFTRGSLIFSNAPEPEADLRILEAAPDGTGVRTLWEKAGTSATLIAASNDGETLVANLRQGEQWGNYVIDRRSDRTIGPLNGGAVASFSPDGRWLAFVSMRSGATEVWIAPWDDPSSARQVSSHGGHEPVWCRGCDDLFFRVGTTWFAARMRRDRETIEWDPPRRVWSTGFADASGLSYAVSRDGSSLLVSKQAEPDVTDRVHAIHNWHALLGGR